ncbi:nSTAND1 domain-containing NTPase [Nostoc sp. 'Peltigera malacea cyanobiont' DB3992]|uniref:nSTAND1 domain-containing NTPase n=1 Tax=Nostoc sp. 'Peltigera malacea cyanobiont' DB3992 TaxID=1206980 RepID=UPI000C050538|nr:hypothetical protein [Nostoc sp. 'Peltigera malacea cyanobiont' DB3992]PHM05869.1 hypothetical protein CK516_37780 [Nostoc sp. 'Peltigera malacea cyanobiont' DB3992]
MTQYALVVEIAQYDNSFGNLTKPINDAEAVVNTEKFLLVVDEFGEVSTVCIDKEERQRFIELLTGVVEIHDSRLAVVITMRGDFLQSCLDNPSLTHLIQTPVVVIPPLTGVDLKETIAKPTKLQVHSVEEAGALKILQNLQQEPGNLPLLEFALTKLWEKREQKKHQLTQEEYEKLGGLTAVLNLHAENVYHYQDYEQEYPTQERSQQEKEWMKQIFSAVSANGRGEKRIPDNANQKPHY